jgi:hypothetical protein
MTGTSFHTVSVQNGRNAFILVQLKMDQRLCAQLGHFLHG